MKKTVVITGASRGIGAECARQFAKEGYNVVINYNKSEREALTLAKEIGGFALQADVSIEAEAIMLIKKAEEKFGQIDVLVNNAGIAKQNVIFDISATEWNRIFAVNMGGAFNCSKAVLEGMVTRQQGVIINISSIWGEVGASCETAYSSSKSAIIGFTKALAKEVGRSNIRVNCVSPGLIKTDMNSHLSKEDLQELIEETPLNKIGMPKDVANAVLFLASEKASFITGQNIGVNGGFVI